MGGQVRDRRPYDSRPPLPPNPPKRTHARMHMHHHPPTLTRQVDVQVVVQGTWVSSNGHAVHRGVHPLQTGCGWVCGWVGVGIVGDAPRGAAWLLPQGRAASTSHGITTWQNDTPARLHHRQGRHSCSASGLGSHSPHPPTHPPTFMEGSTSRVPGEGRGYISRGEYLATPGACWVGRWAGDREVGQHSGGKLRKQSGEILMAGCSAEAATTCGRSIIV